MEIQTIPNWLKKRADLTPERIALVFHDNSYTFKDMYERVLKIAGQLSAITVKKNQFIGVLLTNHLDSVAILYALQMLGAKTVILNNRLSIDELTWQIEDSSCSYLITESAFDLSAKGIEKKLPELSIYRKDELFKQKTISIEILEEFSLNDVCSVMYTSGTTGFPKGVLQTYGNHWWSAISSALNIGIIEEDCWLCTMPLFHISGYSILIRSVVYGMTVVLHETFDEQKVINDIVQQKVSIMSVVSTMLARIVHALGNQEMPAHFRCMLLGGGPASLPLLTSCTEKRIPVIQTYGMTETASQIVTLSSEYSLRKVGSAGKPLFPSQIKIVDAAGLELGPKEEGEIIVKGPNVTRGYLNQVAATKEKIDNGWLSTGDIGYLDEDGFLYVLDRRSDLIISGGENIYPAEIEGILIGHEKISDAGVIGIEDDQWGQIPVAYIVKKPGCHVTIDEITLYCQQKLAGYKIPKKITFINQLPRNAASKLLRRILREKFESGSGK